MQKGQYKMTKRKMEYSKRIVLWAGVVFVSQIILASLFSWCCKDTPIFSYTVPTSGGIFGAAVGFYLNKAKMENVCKGKINFFKFKMSYLSEHPEHKKEFNLIQPFR
jgi:hypothetical protein